MLKPSLRPFLFALTVALVACHARAAVQAAPSLVDFSLEQLADIVVTSVSRQETRLAEAPASICLISGAEIRRAGAMSLPEALRLAPNLQVARADARNYAVSARGFSSTIENKLLVLTDGRSVYSPLFSGVSWDMQDVLMEDIERLEVNSGPGATIWGANAVNGVINIITRTAADTQGGLLVAGGGAPGRSGALRYGGALGNGGHYDYSGLEVLPNAHLAWSLDNDSLLWTGASRTVRAPSRIDRDLWLVDLRNSRPDAPSYLIAGGPQFASETAQLFELGCRGHRGAALTYAATLFHSDYDKLRTLEPVAGQGAQFGNLGERAARGLELWGRWQVRDDWRLSGGMVVQDIRTSLRAGSRDASGSTGLATNDPSGYWSLRSSHDLADDLQADLSLRHVGSLPRPAVPDYTELDACIAWQPQPQQNRELSLNGQDLLHRAHAEFGAAATRQLVERAVLLKLALRF
jgi:outer membrane receptor protein involved in Fe transport